MVHLKENAKPLTEAAPLDRKSGGAEGSAVRPSDFPNSKLMIGPALNESRRSQQPLAGRFYPGREPLKPSTLVSLFSATMEFTEAIKIALQSLWANKLRSILTLMGVMIGVAAVIMVITLVNGANKFVATKVYGYGADVFTASKQPSVIFSDAEFNKYQKRKDLKIDDYREVAAKCKDCASTGAMASVTGKVVYNSHSSTDTSIRGWTWTMPPIYNMNIDRGRGFVPIDEEHNSKVAIIGPDIVDNQMGSIDPIGKEIRVDGSQYTVIGVGERKGKTLGQSQDNWVAIPLTTFLNAYGSNRSLTIYARANGVGDPLELAVGEVRTILRSHRHDRARSRRQLLDRYQQHVRRHLAKHQLEFFGCLCFACRYFAGGRRHRDHEHHAGERYRTDAGNWGAQGAGCAAQRCAAAIPDRIGHHVAGRRLDRRHCRGGLCQSHHPDHRLPFRYRAMVGRPGPVCGHGSWYFFRSLSGAQGLPA